ncbi:hypothetical protein [Ornithinibacillus sp. JPR2-1]|uniref:hypothetical protein n=1 Tax=Ornithinibacillus sp. JPR2-1 TaxID=2094019 RepID=UPI0031D2A97B
MDVPKNDNPIDVDEELELVYKKLVRSEEVTEADMMKLESLANRAGGDAVMKYELVYCKYLIRNREFN